MRRATLKIKLRSRALFQRLVPAHPVRRIRGALASPDISIFQIDESGRNERNKCPRDTGG